jgi:hypothetical protein
MTTQYAEFAIFSSNPGNENYVVEYSGAATHPNILCSGGQGVPSCIDDTYLDFTVSLEHLDFIAVMQNSNTGEVAQVRVFENGMPTDTIGINGIGQPGLVAVSLSGFDDITRIEIMSITAPLGLDNFVLVQTPELATACALLLGTCLLAGRRLLRRRLNGPGRANSRLRR